MEKPLFPAELISRPSVNSLPAGYTLPPLMERDYERRDLDVLRVLSAVGGVSKEQFAANSLLIF
jgi:glucosamine-phosphate N-acetyltransferase